MANNSEFQDRGDVCGGSTDTALFKIKSNDTLRFLGS